MFECKANLFLRGSNNANSAKTLLNECKKLISDVNIEGEIRANLIGLKQSINSCDIDGLISTIEETKKSLIKLDESFASEYMQTLKEYLNTDSINNSALSDEERMKYSIQMNSYARDYNYTLLYMLEKYEDTDQLTPELQMCLQYQKVVVEQYSIQDQMAVLKEVSDEYVQLFQKNAEYDRMLIKFDINLTDEEKNKKIENYDTDYSNKLLELQKALDEKKKEGANLARLEYLSKLKEQKSNNWIPFDEDDYDDEILALKKELDMLSPSEEAYLNEYVNMTWYEKLGSNAGAYLASTVEGIASVGEAIMDGGAMICGKVGSVFGADTKWAEDFVKIDFSGDAYRGFVLATDWNEYTAYGTAHTAGNFTGEMLATISLQFLPGGTYVMAAAHGLKGMGSASESALLGGSSFEEAYKYGKITGAIEAGSAYLLYGKTSNSNKVVDNVGKWLNKGINKIPGVNSVTSYSGGLFNKFATTGMKDYAKAVFKPNLTTKIIVAGSKEYAKEGVSTIIDGDFDWSKAWTKSWQSMGTTVFNEFVVSPIVNKATGASHSKDKIKKYNQEKDKTEALDYRIKKLQEQERIAASSTANESMANSDFAPISRSVTELDQLKAAYEAQRQIMQEAYKDVKLWDKFVGSDFLNKFAKKVGSEFIKQEVYN